MKSEFPKDHGLSAQVVEQLVFKEDDRPALTDAQFDALHAGVGRGESALVGARSIGVHLGWKNRCSRTV